MLRLRPFRTPDAKEIVTWTSEAEEFYKWSAGRLGDFPVLKERLLEAVSGRESNTGYFPLTAFDDEGPVGFFTIRSPGEDDRKVRFGYIIINPTRRGHGYGKEMIKLGLKFAFDIYGANEVSLGVFEDNKPAYYCYKSVGFEENGISEECTIGGRQCLIIDMICKIKTGR